VDPPYLWVPHLQIQATMDQKYSEKRKEGEKERKRAFRTLHRTM